MPSETTTNQKSVGNVAARVRTNVIGLGALSLGFHEVRLSADASVL